jgi:two-component system phosphate regulon response regulator PhoB
MTDKPFAIIVDDEHTLAEMFALALQIVGFETEVLEDGRMTLDRMAARLPVLVTLDVQMPFLSGVDILRQIRSDSRFAGVKVMMVTANARAVNQPDIQQLADVVLLKPVTLTQIRHFALRLVQTG